MNGTIFRTPGSSVSREESLPGKGKRSLADLVVYCLILLLGAIAFTLCVKAPQELLDTRYSELAHSILKSASYQFDFRPETMIPPGFPLILAIIYRIAGYGQAVQYHVIALFTTLALIASYEFLRKTEGRVLAATATLLLASSPAIFILATQIVFSDMPYYFTSMCTLLLAVKIENVRRERLPIGWMLAFTVFLVSSLMIRSVGVTLAGALFLWICASFVANVKTGRQRLKLFVIPFLLAASAQGFWTHWASSRQFAEWPLPGYPASYLAQLKVKNGEHPELGAAHLSDIPQRIAVNTTTRAAELVKLVSGKRWINPFWCSPATIGVIGLIVFGWASSIRKTGGQLHDWYFAGYELMFALWPWDFEMRFLMPIAPLACLYWWRGAQAIRNSCSRRPRALGWSFLAAGALLAAASWRWAIQAKLSQAILAVGFWSLLALVGCWMLRSRDRNAWQWLPNDRRLFTAARIAALLLVAFLVGRGVAAQLHIGRGNLALSLTQSPFYPEIEAAQWIASHEPPQSIVMSRKQDLVYHYSNRRVVWFPPLSNPQVLMDGIRKYKVGVVVVADSDDDSFKPSQQACFQPLYHAYGQAFQLVHRGPGNWVFEVRLADDATPRRRS